MTRETHRIGLVGRGDVDDAVLHLHVERPHLVGLDHTEAAALDHRRAAHADARVGRRDDQVGAAEERRVAREASTRCDPDARDNAGEASPEGEGHDVETGDHRVIGVARPPPPPSANSTTGRRRRSMTSKSRSFLRCPITPWVPASTV